MSFSIKQEAAGSGNGIWTADDWAHGFGICDLDATPNHVQHNGIGRKNQREK